MKTFISLGALLAAVSIFPVHAADKAPQKRAPGPSSRIAPSVLNFDADVIEGEKSNPDLFIQLGNQQPSLQAVIYGRKNFNEFQKHEAPWKPVYREVTPTGTSNGKSAVRPSK
ncbi:MAG: hypothetical protein ACJ763_06150 [Bdellovibrionia bacterium]